MVVLLPALDLLRLSFHPLPLLLLWFDLFVLIFFLMLLAGVGGPAGSVKVVFSSCVVLLSGEDILSYLAPIARCIAVQLLHARCIAASISIQRIHFHVCAPPLLCFVVYSCVSIDLMKVCRFMYWLIRLSWESLTFCIYFHVPTLLVSSLIMQVLCRKVEWEKHHTQSGG